MARDPYSVLAVGRQATADEIRKAYRKLAKAYHPDQNQGDPTAEEKFKAVSVAFDILGDKAKKARFDRGEIDAEGNERPTMRSPFGQAGARPGGPRPGPGHPGARGPRGPATDDFGDILSDFFGQKGGRAPRSAPQKGQDIRYRLAVDFMDAARGVTKRVALPDGRGVDVAIPEGLRDGQTLRLRGQGNPGTAGGPPGDVLVDVAVRPHPVYSMRGEDLQIEVPITLREAVLGGRIEIPTLRGPVAIKLPPNTSGGVTFRLKGKGLKDAKSGDIGDLFARTRIVLPEKPDPALENFVNGWDGDRADPRGPLRAATES